MALGKREADFWAKMRQGMAQIKPLGRPILLNRIESPGTGRGVPDIFLADPEHGSCWIELKAVQHQKVNISLLQSVWLRNHSACGVRCRIVAHVKRPEHYDYIRVWDGIAAEAVRQRGLRVTGIGDVLLNGQDDIWRAVRSALFFRV